MASKQAVTTKKTVTKGAAAAAASTANSVGAEPVKPVRATAAKPVRAATPKAPRVSSAKHSKTIAPETAVPETIVIPVASAPSEVNPREAISKLAYGYWVSRGFQGGNPHEDWLRAEREFHASH